MLDNLNPDELRDAALGVALPPGMHRIVALRRVAKSDFPNKVALLEQIVGDAADDPGARYVAARYIGKLETREAAVALARLTSVTDNNVLAGVFRGLGRAGGPEELDAIDNAMPRATGHAAEEGRFAAALIAYRAGLEGHEPAWPERSAAIKPARSTHPIALMSAAPDDRDHVIETLGAQVYGLAVGTSHLYRVGCDGVGAPMALLLATPAAGPNAVETLGRRRAVAGVLLHTQTDHKPFVTAVLLTRPRGAVIELLVTDPRGRAIFAGEASRDKDVLRFEMWALPRPKAFATEIVGHYDGSRMRLSRARAGTTVAVPPRRPEPIHHR